MWSRIHLIPVLQAEEDRDQVRRHLADQAREKELMGENFKVFHSDRLVVCPSLCGPLCDWQYALTLLSGFRYVRPTYAATPKDVSK